jgi:hypothetical protein
MKDRCGSVAAGAFEAGRAFDAFVSMPVMLFQSALRGLAQWGCGKSYRTCGSTASTDIQWRANAGEVRSASILVENNQKTLVAVVPQPQPWIDSEGKQVNGGLLTVAPQALSLAPGEAGTIVVTARVAPPLMAGMAYYTDLVFASCSNRAVSVGLLVNPASRHDLFVACSRCCGTQARFVEMCQDRCSEPCGCGCGCGCDASCRKCRCCSSCCCCEPCSPWPGCWDPHRHWIEDRDCDLIYIPRPARKPAYR